MRTKINEALENVLKQFGEKYFIDGVVNKSKVIQDLDTYDKELLTAFLSNEVLKDNFTMDIAGNTVLQTNKLIDLLEADEYWQDSYTKYSKKIGLTVGGKFIDENEDVVLDFPYKDTILKASMSKEDTDKDDLRPDEPFLNEVIAKEEIDVLLDKKIFVNAKKYDKSGEHDIESFDENDNLIIKGNNLLALHTLKEKYVGKIKCIYIDPPYNPRSDANTFGYNNRFNQSTWLTFMKNRLEIARRLLSDDGIIYIDIDHNELFYLGVLADEIFGYENRIGNLAVVHNLKGRYNGFFSIAHENKLVYAKNSNNAVIKEMLDDTEHKYPHKDEISRYKIVNLQRTGVGSLRSDRPNLYYPIYFNEKTGEISTNEMEDSIKILPIDDNGVERRWRWGRNKVESEWKTEMLVRKQKSGYKIYTKIREKGDRPKTLWNKPEYSGTTGTNRLKELIGENNFSFPKSVNLVVDALSIATDEDSIVLDFFGGSGTTAEAVLELNKKDNGNRKFILIEQMNYIENITLERVKKYIESQRENNSSSFIYVELMEKNKGFIDALRKCETQNDIDKLFTFMLEEAEIDFRVDLEKVKDTLHELSLDDQKKTLFKIIEKNQLYYNYSEIDDENVRDLISDSDYKFNKSFYEGGE